MDLAAVPSRRLQFSAASHRQVNFLSQPLKSGLALHLLTTKGMSGGDVPV